MTAGIEAVEKTWSRFGSFINTLLIILAAMTAIYAYGQKDEATARDIRDNKDKIERVHDKLVERIAETKEREGGVNAKLVALEAQTLLAVRTVDQVSYRVTVVEEAIKELSSSSKEASANLGQVASELQVIKAILTRMEKKQP